MEKKTLIQSKNITSSHRGDKWHNTEVDRRMDSGDAKIVDLIGEYLQTKEKIRMGGGG
jgi:hypothetical protein